MPNDDSWLERVREETLEPDLPIVDPHHHFWDRGGHRRYLKDEFLRDKNSGHNVVATVYLECGSEYRKSGPEALRPVGETEYVEAIARRCASEGPESAGVCAGIVGFADLTLGDAVEEVLRAHVAAAPARFRGIRQMSAWDESEDVRYPHISISPKLLSQPQFRAGFAHLAPLGLTYDAWLFHPQIPQLTDLARAFPETTIILDHFGGPLAIGPYAQKRDEARSDWKRNIAALADCPNVVVKLGGLLMEINGFGFHERDLPPGSEELADATRDHYLYTIDCFSPERCMFESNFPVDRMSCSYHVLWNSFKRIAADFSAQEKASLFRDTATRVYRLADA